MPRSKADDSGVTEQEHAAGLAAALHPGSGKRLGQTLLKLRRRLYVDRWFPHVPLAIAVAILGIMNILPVLHEIGFGQVVPPVLDRLLTVRTLAGVPQAVAGLMLLAMAAGLVLRSRLSWAITLLVATASLTIVWHAGPIARQGLALFDGLTLVALLLFQRHFDRSSLAAGTLFAAVSVLLLLGYAVFGALVLGQGFSPPITTLADSAYFAVVTMSTVGYGDIVPRTVEARLFVMSIILLGITVFATSISAVIVPAVSGRMQRLMKGGSKKMIRKNHYVIVGDTPLARNTHRELIARELSVTRVVAEALSPGEFTDADCVVGDPSDAETLREAGAMDAAAVLALRADDSENAFTVLAVKELGGSARTVAAVNQSKNIKRVRGVHPDMIIAPQVMGGELLAMALNGEQLDSDTVMARLFHTEAGDSAGGPV
ncbi:MAG: voltage-gated potassium channel protein [Acidiferrobacter sp.]